MRKIVQIVADGDEPLALCDECTVWYLRGTHGWERIKDIPQDDEVAK